MVRHEPVVERRVVAGGRADLGLVDELQEIGDQVVQERRDRVRRHLHPEVRIGLLEIRRRHVVVHRGEQPAAQLGVLEHVGARAGDLRHPEEPQRARRRRQRAVAHEPRERPGDLQRRRDAGAVVVAAGRRDRLECVRDGDQLGADGSDPGITAEMTFILDGYRRALTCAFITIFWPRSTYACSAIIWRIDSTKPKPPRSVLGVTDAQPSWSIVKPGEFALTPALPVPSTPAAPSG